MKKGLILAKVRNVISNLLQNIPFNIEYYGSVLNIFIGLTISIFANHLTKSIDLLTIPLAILTIINLIIITKTLRTLKNLNTDIDEEIAENINEELKTIKKTLPQENTLEYDNLKFINLFEITLNVTKSRIKGDKSRTNKIRFGLITSLVVILALSGTISFSNSLYDRKTEKNYISIQESISENNKKYTLIEDRLDKIDSNLQLFDSSLNDKNIYNRLLDDIDSIKMLNRKISEQYKYLLKEFEQTYSTKKDENE